MDMNRFTEKAQEAIAGAQRIATRLSNQQVDVEHLLLSLLDQENGLAPAILVGLFVYPVLAIAFRILSREEMAQLFEMIRARRQRVPAERVVEI